VKALASNEQEPRRFESGPTLTPQEMVEGVLAITDGWSWDVVSTGIPTPVHGGMPIAEPVNLGHGWVGFDYEAAFGKPTKLVNDAAMQALGSYEGGRMLFLGLGTGLGSALIVDSVLEPLELGHLPFRKKTFEDYVSARAREARQEEVEAGGVRGRRAPVGRDAARLRRHRRRRGGRARRAAAERETRRQLDRVRRRLPSLGSRLADQRHTG
jgi:predicted NBD/HSP70 family sugar kinase